jgi:hypothetical protein
MRMADLWSEDKERDALADSMFATISCKKCGYVEKSVFRRSSDKCPNCGAGPVAVSEFNQRNAIVADATERFALQLFQSVVNGSSILKGSFFVKRNVECPQLELRNRTKADLAILDKNLDGPVTPERIKCIFEVKMSIIWNWSGTDRRQPLADYDSHAGRPSIYRTDSILKAIGKAAITRACKGSERIPFVVVGNTPPPVAYRDKVDGTVRSGLIQRWISLTPRPLVVKSESSPSRRDPKETFGFLRVDSTSELEEMFVKILTKDWRYVGAMVEPKKIGGMIRGLDLSKTDEEIGEAFLVLMESIRID